MPAWHTFDWAFSGNSRPNPASKVLRQRSRNRTRLGHSSLRYCPQRKIEGESTETGTSDQRRHNLPRTAPSQKKEFLVSQQIRRGSQVVVGEFPKHVIGLATWASLLGLFLGGFRLLLNPRLGKLRWIAPIDGQFSSASTKVLVFHP